MSPLLIYASIVIVLFLIHKYYQNVKKYPAGPTPLPIIGNLLQISSTHLQKQLDEMSKTYGPCYTLWLPFPIVIITNYKYLKEAFVAQADLFTGRSHKPPEILFQETPNIGILISDGEIWRENRRVSLKIFRDFGMGKSLMEEQVKRSLIEMLHQLKTFEGKSFDMRWPIQLCVGNVINETLFGYHYSYENFGKFRQLINVIQTQFDLIKTMPAFLVQSWEWLKHVPIIGWLGYHRIVKNFEKYHDFIKNEVEEQIRTFNKDAEPDTFIHAYMLEMQKNSILDKKNLFATAKDFWLAGMETTSTSLRWHILYMLKFPQVQTRVREEIARVVGFDRLPSLSDKSNMPYTQAVIHELQRHSNMVPLLGYHRCLQDTTLIDTFIPKDTLVWGQVYSVLKNDPSFDEPEKFNPERFLSEDGKSLNKDKLERLVAFGLGKRACVGESLARLELFVIFSALMQKYVFRPVVPESELDLEPIFSTVLLPQDYQVNITPVDRTQFDN